MVAIVIGRPIQRALLAVAEWAAARAGRFLIALEYPPSADNHPRYGYGKPPHPQLREFLRGHESRYSEHLREAVSFTEQLVGIPVERVSPTQPHWAQPWLSGLDALSLYSFVRRMTPRRYVEIGSGVSTMWVRRAIEDGQLSTRITSIDPAPRHEINAISDELIRQPLELTNLELFGALDASDVVLMDGSHRTFMNSDATVFFLEVLPALPRGVLVAIHDIALPLDYRPEWTGRYYSEQYLLAAYLLGGGAGMRVELPCTYVRRQRELRGIYQDVFEQLGVPRLAHRGSLFWFTTV